MSSALTTHSPVSNLENTLPEFKVQLSVVEYEVLVHFIFIFTIYYTDQNTYAVFAKFAILEI